MEDILCKVKKLPHKVKNISHRLINYLDKIYIANMVILQSDRKEENNISQFECGKGKSKVHDKKFCRNY